MHRNALSLGQKISNIHAHSPTTASNKTDASTSRPTTPQVQNILRANLQSTWRGQKVRRIYTHVATEQTNTHTHTHTHVRMKTSACAPLQKLAYRYKRLDENDPTTTTPLQIGGIKSEGTRGTHRREQSTERCQGHDTHTSTQL